MEINMTQKLVTKRNKKDIREIETDREDTREASPIYTCVHFKGQAASM